MTVSDYINPLHLRYALWGTKITQCWGIGCTDWFIGDIPKICFNTSRRAALFFYHTNSFIGLLTGMSVVNDDLEACIGQPD